MKISKLYLNKFCNGRTDGRTKGRMDGRAETIAYSTFQKLGA